MTRAAVGGSRSVESYLRNFEGEKARYQEILEITLCYGVQCLAQTFSLKGINCDELRIITGYDAARKRDFYVRNVSRQVSKRTLQRTPVELRTKPSHSWRDGEEDMADFHPPATRTEPESCVNLEDAAVEPDVQALIKSVTNRPGLKDIALQAHLLSPLKSMAEQKPQETSEDAANRPNPQSPLLSATERGPGAILEDAASGLRSQSLKPVTERGTRGDSGYHTRGANQQTTRKHRPLHPQPQPRKELVTPRSLQHVRSKLQPELDARRQKILRVKKTQSQRMAETLARARLAEYDAQRELQDVRERRLGPKKMPLSEITKGAAALEIVDDFMKSPLMDKFGHDGPTASNNSKHPTSDCIQQRRSQPDPLKEELYGTTALDNSFLGCKPPPEARRRKTQSTRPKRNYNRWLGDFGLLHTKTVRPEWDEAEDGAEDTDQRFDRDKFEWNFEHLPGGHHEPVGHKLRDTKTRARFKPEQNDIGDSDDDIAQSVADDASDIQSINSDPVFRWLKDAI